MANTAIGIGVLLILVGVGGYAASETKSVTALIPSIVGLIIAILGAIARNERYRKHAMHFAALIGLIGFSAAALRLGFSLTKPDWNGLIVSSLAAMALLCLLFVLLCVRSFVEARRRRTQV